VGTWDEMAFAEVSVGCEVRLAEITCCERKRDGRMIDRVREMENDD
jgi:hypothetical protein